MVRMLKDQHSQPFTVKANQISRRKSSVSKEKLKLLFKQHCEPNNGTIALKPSSVLKYRLAEQSFSQFFPDDPPMFPFSPKAARSSPAQTGSALLKEKLQLLHHREEMASAAQDRNRLQEAKRREREDKERMKEEQRRRFEEEKVKRREEKEQRKLEKDREREKLKEEKKKYAERLKLWSKPREDMECEDLKDLPLPVPVRTRLPAGLFGDALLVLEFLRAFGEIYGLKDEFPDGVSLKGPLCELLFFFLSAIFQALDEEQEDLAKDQTSQRLCLTEALDDDSDSPQSALSAASSLAGCWPQLTQGSSLKQLDLDSCTLSEILRLHIVASGADGSHGNAKFRYQKQGGFTLMDDPCVELRLAEPALMKRLSSCSVYDLTPGEKLQILQALVGKLLTLASCRDVIEDCVEDQRVRQRKEEKLREQEQRLKEREGANSETPDEKHTEEDEEQNSSSNKTTKVNQQMTLDLKPASCPPPSSLTAEEQEEEQEKVQQLQQRIQKAASCTSLQPLGRDRLYRRYWLLPSICSLLVEEDGFGLTEDIAGSNPAPLLTCGPPVKRPNQWAFYTCEEEVGQLIEALNPRGHRESSLKEALMHERERITHLLKSCDRKMYCYTDDPESSRSVPECTAAAETLMEGRLRDLLLDIEDRIHQGTLGTLKVWRSALEAGKYELLSSESGGAEPMEVDSPAHLRAKDSSVRLLSQALSHIELGIERRFLKAPLDGSDSGRVSKTVLERWRESLQSCSSLSQVFVHLSSLERSVLWSRSVLNARCRICRRKGDGDNMLLCDGFCSWRRLVLSGLSTQTKIEPPAVPKKSQAPPPRGRSQQTLPPRARSQQATPKGQQATPKGQQATPKGQQATPKNTTSSSGKNSSASKSSGKKATPPKGKVTPHKGKATPPAGKAPPRSGSRVSARLSHEILATTTTKKTSPGQSEARKRPATACEQLVVELVRHDDSWPFIKLVSRTKVCMVCPGEFVTDMELMFSNCLQYNPRHTNEAKAGTRLQLFFHAELRRLGLSERSRLCQSERSPAPPAKRSRQ
ncbi:Bromodomain adjacent to zinc finger domain protein 1A [Dissostichus eleginoides]|uniref:Bromodomain adjacent to zinc finger domain protein 1A n=1 Tax=Dissostichus eleginoides TaxID=100907 RepID=A0AAD9EMP7_DISEL|nr:Bromodomain adjacent to zinc finger domain protein 1A [Dissostichus eleginoides]